jgi:hypothetical protein
MGTCITAYQKVTPVFLHHYENEEHALKVNKIYNKTTLILEFLYNRLYTTDFIVLSLLIF